MAMTYDAYAVIEITPEGFVVEIPLARDYDITFSWTALMVEGETAQVEVVKDKLEAVLDEYDKLESESPEASGTGQTSNLTTF